MIFLARTRSPSEWKVIAGAIQTLVDEASFEATAEGLIFRAMDPSHVALIDLEWPNTAFDRYECDQQFRFTVRVEDFVKVLKTAGANDQVEIASEDGETLTFKMQDGYKKEFSIHLLESTQSPTPLPKVSFNARIVMVQDVFEKILKDINTISDHVTIEADEAKVVFTGKSDLGRGAITVDQGSNDLLELKVKEASKATYSLDYLLNITKAVGKAAEKVVCELSSKMPLRLEFDLGEQGGKIRFYLAPRIEEG
jgi:proliferating cell nuclear antigen